MKLSALLLAVTATIATFTMPATAFAGNNVYWSISFSNGYYPQRPAAWSRPNATIVFSNAPRFVKRRPIIHQYPRQRIIKRIVRSHNRPMRNQRFYRHNRYR